MSRHDTWDEAVRALLDHFESQYNHWILNADHTVSPAELLEWAAWFEAASKNGTRIVKQEQAGPYFISTVFLGTNHRLLGAGPPLLFETMVFQAEGARELEVDLMRCSTWEQAEQQHAAMRELIRMVEG